MHLHWDLTLQSQKFYFSVGINKLAFIKYVNTETCKLLILLCSAPLEYIYIYIIYTANNNNSHRIRERMFLNRPPAPTANRMLGHSSNLQVSTSSSTSIGIKVLKLKDSWTWKRNNTHKKIIILSGTSKSAYKPIQKMNQVPPPLGRNIYSAHNSLKDWNIFTQDRSSNITDQQFWSSNMHNNKFLFL